MQTKEKIEKLYKKVANKKWVLGCRFRFKNDEYKRNFVILQSTPYGSSCNYIEDGIVKSPEFVTEDINQPQFIYKYEWGKHIDMIDFSKTTEEQLLLSIDTIGNPLMVGDFIKYCGENDIAIRVDNEGEIFEYDCYEDDNGIEIWKTTGISWDELIKPLDTQNEELINYFYELVYG